MSHALERGTGIYGPRISHASNPTTIGSVSARIERLPITSWHTRTRMIAGLATFFDAFDALAIAQILPVLVPAWRLNPTRISLLISAGYLGQLVGALFFSAVAERYGRVRALRWCILIFSGMSLLCCIAWNYNSLVVFRTIQGFGLGGEVPIAAVYIAEITRAQGRGRFVLLYELIFSVGVLAAGIIGYFMVPHLGWQSMFLVGALPALLVLPLQRLLPESPRWLASCGQYARAEAELERIETAVEKACGYPLAEPRPSAEAPMLSSGWWELFSPMYRRRTFVIWTIWFGSYMIYYGIGTWLPTLYRAVFHLPLNVALQYGLITNIVGLAGATVCALTIDQVGRRVWFSVSLIAAGLLFGVLFLLGCNAPWQVIVFGSAGYFFATAAAVGAYLYTPELYPTRIRALGTGAATAWLRISSMIGPIIVGAFVGFGLGSVFLIFGAVAVVAGLMVAAFAVESKGRVLEELSP